MRTIALVAAVSLAGCSGGGKETPDRCVARFTKSMASLPVTGGARTATYTYDIGELPDDERTALIRGRDGPAAEIVVAMGDGVAAREEFLRTAVTDRPRVLIAEHPLYRVRRDTPRSAERVISDGCAMFAGKARLLRIDTVAVPGA
jgi:hypothetical protein